jgi:hypothetical protein
MPQSLEKSVFRVLNADGVIVGSGFLLAPTLGVTCAHVIEEAGIQPGEAIQIHLHLADQPCDGLVRKEGFSPFEEQDIAFIELSAPQPGTEPVAIGSSDHRGGHDYIALGYPEFGEVEARWPKGKIGGIVRANGQTRLDIQGRKSKRD